MNAFQLVTRHLYFGVDALRLQIAAGRVLMRIHGRPPDRSKRWRRIFGWTRARA
jgi:hypothetical protein